MVKKLLGVILLLAMFFSTLSIMPALAVGNGNNTPVPTLTKTGNTPVAGSVIKAKGKPALYYVGEDGKRYVFPNSSTYFSWFNDFSEVQEVDPRDLSNYELAGNIRYKPGAILVKIQSDPKVYAVGSNGQLRWVKTEKIAKILYGKDWNKLIDDIPVHFFGNYRKGDPIEGEEDFEPTEEEEQAPTIAHNRGFKPFARFKARTAKQKMCGRLEGALERLQKRFKRWGADITNEADEVLDRCYDIRDNIIDQIKDKKVIICHKGETLSVAAPALKGRIKHGDTLGECGEDSSNIDDSDDADDQDDSDDDQGDVDETAPVISNIVATPSATSTVIIWNTDEDSKSKVYYAIESFVAATEIFNESDNTMVTVHSLGLMDLATSTEYFYYVESEDADGNIATSTEDTFITLVE